MKQGRGTEREWPGRERGFFFIQVTEKVTDDSKGKTSSRYGSESCKFLGAELATQREQHVQRP